MTVPKCTEISTVQTATRQIIRLWKLKCIKSMTFLSWRRLVFFVAIEKRVGLPLLDAQPNLVFPDFGHMQLPFVHCVSKKRAFITLLSNVSATLDFYKQRTEYLMQAVKCY